eukprot:8855195-Pyramimonas_sp.AAC.1
MADRVLCARRPVRPRASETVPGWSFKDLRRRMEASELAQVRVLRSRLTPAEEAIQDPGRVKRSVQEWEGGREVFQKLSDGSVVESMMRKAEEEEMRVEPIDSAAAAASSASASASALHSREAAEEEEEEGSEDEEEAQEQEKLWSTLLSWGEALSDGYASFVSLPGASKAPVPQRGSE